MDGDGTHTHTHTEADKHMGLARRYLGKHLKDPKDMRNYFSVLIHNDLKQALLDTGVKHLVSNTFL